MQKNNMDPIICLVTMFIVHLGGDVRLFLFLLNLSMFSPNTSPVLNLRDFENLF